MNYISEPVVIKFTFEENPIYDIDGEKKLTLLELSIFLYNLNLLNVCLVAAAFDEYKYFEFRDFFRHYDKDPFYKLSFSLERGILISSKHKLYLDKINHNSPLGLEIIIPAIAAGFGIPWLLLQAFEKISNWKYNKEKLKLEIENLRLQNQKLNKDNFNQDLELYNLLRQRKALATFEHIILFIEHSGFNATDIEFKKVKNDKNNIQEK